MGCDETAIRKARQAEKQNLETLQRLVVLLLAFAVISVLLIFPTLLREK